MAVQQRAWHAGRRIVALAVAYYLAGRIGLSVGTLPGAVSPVWAPTGIAIAGAYLFGPSVLPAVFIGEFFIMRHQGSSAWFVTVMPALGNVAEAYVGATLLRRLKFDPSLGRPRSVGTLAIVGFGAPLISAAVGIGTVWAAGIAATGDVPESFRVWWFGNALGALVVIPFILSWAAPRDDKPEGGRLEFSLLVLAFLLTFATAFIGDRPTLFLVFPAVVWAGLRFGIRATSTFTLIAAVIAVERTAAGVGRFVTGNPIQDLYLIDTFLTVLSLTGLLLASVVAERNRMQRELITANSELEARVAERTNALGVDRFRLEQAQRVARIGSWELDSHTNAVSASAELDRLFGVDRTQEPSHYSTYSHKLVDEDRVALQDLMRAAIMHGDTFTADVRIRLDDRSLRWLRITGEPNGEPGDVSQLYGSAQDITANKAAEDQIRANEERAAATVEASSEAFISMNLVHGITEWNMQAERTFGWRKDDVLGRSLVEIIIPPTLREAHLRGVARFLETGEAHVLDTRTEVTALHRDGHEFPVDMAVWMTHNAEGDPTFHAYLHDISERQADKAKLAFALEEAREASRMKSAFLANMSHEIRTPMNGVLGMVGFLLDTELDSTQRDYVQTMATSAEALMGIIDDVLDVSKIEAGKLEIEEGDFDLRRLLQDSLRPFMSAANEKSVALGVTVSDSVPDAIRGDRLRLRQVISNLVSNAVKFTAIGSVNVSVRTWDDKLLFEVTDTGIGILEDRRTQLFEPFIQADASTTRRYGGTGLGLAICRQLITLMGGDIGVTAAQGGGSRFWFSMPLVAAIAPPAPPVASGQRERVTHSRGAGRTVLVVEDNPVNRKVAVGMLERLGFAVEIAVDGVEAVSLWAAGAFDAILMDCQMPRMDGYDATQVIRAQETTSHTPIIAMTASAMASDRDKCLAAGMDDFISKPIGREKLGATLINWIGESSAAADAAAVAAPLEETPPFDREVAEHLRALDDDGSFLLDLLTMFREDSKALLSQLHDAIAAENTTAIRGLSHQLKGSTGLLGLVALSAACAAVERDHESVPTALGHMDQVLCEYDRALTYIDELATRTAAAQALLGRGGGPPA